MTKGFKIHVKSFIAVCLHFTIIFTVFVVLCKLIIIISNSVLFRRQIKRKYCINAGAPAYCGITERCFVHYRRISSSNLDKSDYRLLLSRPRYVFHCDLCSGSINLNHKRTHSIKPFRFCLCAQAYSFITAPTML